jgi:hypothetical protein
MSKSRHITARGSLQSSHCVLRIHRSKGFLEKKNIIVLRNLVPGQRLGLSKNCVSLRNERISLWIMVPRREVLIAGVSNDIGRKCMWSFAG